MRLLLDTHVFIWLMVDSPRLGRSVTDIFETEGNRLYFSVASVWEIAIKRRLNELDFIGESLNAVHQLLHDARIEVLPITVEHALAVADLPLHHRDPFDRMLAVQAKAEDIILVSKDEVFDAYDVRRLW